MADVGIEWHLNPDGTAGSAYTCPGSPVGVADAWPGTKEASDGGTLDATTYTLTLPKESIEILGIEIVSEQIGGTGFLNETYIASVNAYFGFEIVTASADIVFTHFNICRWNGTTGVVNLLDQDSVGANCGSTGILDHYYVANVDSDGATTDRLVLQCGFQNLAAHSAATIQFKLNQTWDTGYENHMEWGGVSTASIEASVPLAVTDDVVVYDTFTDTDGTHMPNHSAAAEKATWNGATRTQIKNNNASPTS